MSRGLGRVPSGASLGAARQAAPTSAALASAFGSRSRSWTTPRHTTRCRPRCSASSTSGATDTRPTAGPAGPGRSTTTWLTWTARRGWWSGPNWPPWAASTTRRRPRCQPSSAGTTWSAAWAAAGWGRSTWPATPGWGGTWRSRCFAPPWRPTRQARDRFRREALAAGRLDHPNVVPALEAGEETARPYLVSAYVEGEDLAHLVRRAGPVDLPAGHRLRRPRRPAGWRTPTSGGIVAPGRQARQPDPRGRRGRPRPGPRAGPHPRQLRRGPDGDGHVDGHHGLRRPGTGRGPGHGGRPGGRVWARRGAALPAHRPGPAAVGRLCPTARRARAGGPADAGGGPGDAAGLDGRGHPPAGVTAAADPAGGVGGRDGRGVGGVGRDRRLRLATAA